MRRCVTALFLMDHDVVLQQRRAEAGRLVKPHVIEWHCQRCQRVVATTELKPSWPLLSWLRRQAVALRAREADATKVRQG